ncbi:Protein DCL, chloroplastic [Glycine max]|nr:Protein DCL, chloroplastic [Glycine max]
MMMISTSTMALASLLPKTAPHVLSLTNPSASTPFILPFSFHCLPHPPLLSALKASSSGGDDLRGKPLLSQGIGKGILEEHAFEDDDDDKWVDWEDQILEDTVPLVGFVRMILHSGQLDIILILNALVREDGELVDFSYWKCIKGLIRKNYPLYADSFILRHFRKKSRNL